MGTVIIFLLVAVLAAIAVFRSLKSKNILGILFSLGTCLIFGWFSIMTLLKSGFPGGH